MKLSEAKLATNGKGSLDWFLSTFFDKVDEEKEDDGTITYTLIPKNEFSVKDDSIEIGDLDVTIRQNGISLYMLDSNGNEMGGMEGDPREIFTVDVTKRVWPK